ncbi:cytochrome c-type biogenesis protein H1 [Salmonella enterica subsp. enterica serovar Daytona]|uniref:Cytochrome c-type biogenesis protein H1 n=1 Tax=Salmonella enterica subsp. enterica serovar Daytona TaxID=1962639 RepID=A0A447JFH4_SALET|nr:cytochrome c-type biogenesis protein H1 [Salmonella enterica subsp. enterica serovar Daytona]
MIATDMRRRVYDLMQEGKSRQENHRLHGGALRQLRHLRPAADPADGAAVGAAAGRHRGGRVDNRRRTRRRVRLRREPLPADPRFAARAPGGAFNVPGVVIALVVAAISYSQTGSYPQVRAWQQATAQTPGLLARALDPQAQPLNEEEMARLALGLRTRLQNDAGQC